MARSPKITDEEILTAARQVFLAQGPSASTLAIAERVGISEAYIFKRFATKRALFLSAMGIAEEPAWGKALANQMPTVAIKSELTDICEQMMGFYQEVLPRILMMMAQGNLSRPPKFRPPPIRHRQLLAGYLKRAMVQGYLRSCDAMTVAAMIVGAITNYVMTQTVVNQLPAGSPLTTIAPVAPNTFVHSLVEILWPGIAPNS